MEKSALQIKGIIRAWGVLIIIAVIFFAGCRDKSSAGNNDGREMVSFSAIGTKVGILDPGNIGDQAAASVATQMFECLYDYHYLKRPYELIPHLAADMPVISDDGLVYTIKIKQGVYFADDKCFAGGRGKELTADDFIFSWKRLANIKYLSKNWWVFDGRIEGLDEFREYTKTCKTEQDVDYSLPVSGLNAIDKYTLQIRLKKPWPQILYMLAHLPTAAIAREAVEYYGRDIINHPVGTGPYVLKKWDRSSYIEMERNPNFRKEYYPIQGQPQDLADGYLADAGKQIPFIDRVYFMLIEEEPPLWFSFLQGKLDMTAIPKDNFEQAIKQGNVLSPELAEKGVVLKIYQLPTTYWIGFNMEDKVVGKNRPLRLAVNHCVNRVQYIDLFTNNRAEEAFGFIPPLMKSYDGNLKNKYKNYDVDLAKKYAAEAEKLYGGRLPVLVLAIPGTDVVSRQYGQFYQKCFKQAGLELEVDYMDWPTYLERLHKKDLQLFQSGWIADYPDEENFLQLFYGKNVSPGPNNFNYVNAEFDAVFEKAAVMTDCPERMELYKKAQQIILDDCPAAFLIHGVAYTLHHGWVGNFKPNAFQYGLTKFRRIDSEKRSMFQRLR